MKTEIIDISKYTPDCNFYDKIDLLLTVKSFDLQAIRERYLKSRNNAGGRRGSVERREVGFGGLVKVSIVGGELKDTEVLATLKEPRGIAARDEFLVISSENVVYVLTDSEIREIKNPWFSYIHSVNFSNTGDRILISSSGFDALFEYDILTGKKTHEWFAWENGFNRGKDPTTGESVILTRDKNYSTEGENILLISDPSTQGLPTAMRAAFINSVEYDTNDNHYFLATFFHEGAIYSINRKTGKPEMVLDNLVTPHGGKRFKNAIMATSTGSGEVVIGNMEEQIRYSFKNLPGKPDSLSNLEWLQNTAVLGNNFITIDSNRTSFVIFNPESKNIDMVQYDNNWAIQDVIAFKLSSEKEELVRKLDVN